MATDPRKRPLSRVAEKARARLAGVEGDGWFFAQIADQVAEVSALAAGLPVWVAAGPSPAALTRAAVKTP